MAAQGIHMLTVKLLVFQPYLRKNGICLTVNLERVSKLPILVGQFIQSLYSSDLYHCISMFKPPDTSGKRPNKKTQANKKPITKPLTFLLSKHLLRKKTNKMFTVDMNRSW